MNNNTPDRQLSFQNSILVNWNNARTTVHTWMAGVVSKSGILYFDSFGRIIAVDHERHYTTKETAMQIGPKERLRGEPRGNGAEEFSRLPPRFIERLDRRTSCCSRYRRVPPRASRNHRNVATFRKSRR